MLPKDGEPIPTAQAATLSSRGSIALTLGRGCSSKEALGTQILVDVRPMNPVSGSCYFPISALLGRRKKESRIPGKGHGDGASVHQVDNERLFIRVDITGS